MEFFPLIKVMKSLQGRGLQLLHRVCIGTVSLAQLCDKSSAASSAPHCVTFVLSETLLIL